MSEPTDNDAKTGPVPRSDPERSDTAGAATPASGGNAAEKSASARGLEPGAVLAEQPPSTDAEALAPHRAATSGRGQTHKLLWTVIAVAVLGGGLYASWPVWAPRLAGYLPEAGRGPIRDPRVNALVDRLEVLEDQARARRIGTDELRDLEAERARVDEQLAELVERMRVLESALDSVKKTATAPAAATPPAIEVVETGEALAKVSRRLDELEKEAGIKGDLQATAGRLEARNRELNAAVVEIAGRIKALEGRGETTAAGAGAQALVLAVGQLRAAVATPGPFAKELDALRGIAGAREEVAKAVTALEPYAASGVATPEVLRAGFDAVALKVVRAALGPEPTDWVAHARRWLAGLVTVRPTGGAVAGNGPEAVLAHAEAHLKAGDLIAAVNELSQLTGPAAEAVAPWLAQARARLVAEQAMAGLHIYAISLVNPT